MDQESTAILRQGYRKQALLSLHRAAEIDEAINTLVRSPEGLNNQVVEVIAEKLTIIRDKHIDDFLGSWANAIKTTASNINTQEVSQDRVEEATEARTSNGEV